MQPHSLAATCYFKSANSLAGNWGLSIAQLNLCVALLTCIHASRSSVRCTTCSLLNPEVGIHRKNAYPNSGVQPYIVVDFRLDAHIRGDLILLSLVSPCRFLLMLGCVQVLIFVHVWKLDYVYMYIFVHARIFFICTNCIMLFSCAARH